MIYLVTSQQRFFSAFECISPQTSIDIIESWGDFIQVDSETSGRNPHLCDVLCFQFGDYEGKDQIVVDTTTVDLKLYKEILETKTLLGVNLAFDDQFLFNYGIVPMKQWDCMIVEQTIHLGFDPKYFHCSYKAIAERRLGIDIDKTVRGEIIWRGLDTKVIQYAATDVQYLGQIMDKQLKDVEEKRITKAVKIENNFVVVNAYLMWCGIRLDVNKWKLKMQDNERIREEALNNLNAWVVDYGKNKWKSGTIEGYYLYEINTYGKAKKEKLPEGKVLWRDTKEESFEAGIVYKYVKVVPSEFPFTKVNREGDLFSGFDLEPKCTINWNSNPQVCDFMEMLGFNVTVEDRKTGKVKRSCTEKVIKKQKGIADDFLKLYFKYTEKEKDCSTYGQNYIDAINPKTGRIHTKFKQIGASSSRMSCGGGAKDKDTDLAAFKKLPAGKCGFPQCQNLPADEVTRSSFIPNDGNVWISVDYAAMESRLGADIYQDQAMLHEYLEGDGDIHSLTASFCFPEQLAGVPIKEIKKSYPDLRKKAKGPEFACQFGGGAKAIADALNISIDEAKIIESNYKEGFKGITEFKQRGSAFVRSNGYVLINKHTGLKIWWEDFDRWKMFDSLPEYIQKQEYTKEERKEFNMSAAKWDRLSLNSPTQGSGAEIIKLAAFSIFKWIVQHNYFGVVLFNVLVHDGS